jgi:hypothetical protein
MNFIVIVMYFSHFDDKFWYSVLFLGHSLDNHMDDHVIYINDLMSHIMFTYCM